MYLVFRSLNRTFAEVLPLKKGTDYDYEQLV